MDPTAEMTIEQSIDTTVQDLPNMKIQNFMTTNDCARPIHSLEVVEIGDLTFLIRFGVSHVTNFDEF